MVQRKCLMAAVLALLLFQARESRAMFGVDQWTGQNQLLIELLVTEMGEAADVAALLANIKMVASATNEGLGLARETFRMYQSIRNYSLEDLLRDSKEGMYRAFPDLRAIEEDAYLLKDQWESRNSFFSYWNRYDSKMNPVLQKLFAHAYQATIWPAVFPNAVDFRPNFTPVEYLIWKRYSTTKQEAEVLVQKTSLGALAKKAAMLVEEAEATKNLAVTSEAMTAQLMTQEVSNSTEFLNLYKSEIAMEEAAKEASLRANNTVRRSLTERAQKIFLPGAMSQD